MKKPEQTYNYLPSMDYIRVATASPEVAIADVETNVARIKKLCEFAVSQCVSLIVFPELSLTGYSIQDLVSRTSLLDSARDGLVDLAKTTESYNAGVVVGLPLAVGSGIYNCAALLADGQIKGVVPKQHLPNYNEFYEKRWYQTWDDRPNTLVRLGDDNVTFGRDQTFRIADNLVGIEVCEDLWVPEQTSIKLVKNGASIIVNPSASPEAVAKSEYRRSLVSSTAGRLVVGYVYSSANESESTAETVMSGHAMINELGHMLAERKPFSAPQPLMIADIDTQHIMHDRRHTTNFPNDFDIIPTDTNVLAKQTELERDIDSTPFIPKGSSEQIAERLDTILDIQAFGLATRLKTSGINRVVLGLSGGLDSTLALLVAVRTSTILGLRPGSLIHTITMPGDASSDRTQSNAISLASSLGIANEEIPISKLSQEQLKAIDHNGEQDVTYENTQARIRQALVFNKANQISALAMGTGDLSEIALGWCTYNGDHMSHYNVNSSIPKTLVKSLVQHAARLLDHESQTIITDILDTPISPELTGCGIEVSQCTEDIIGPYELHDFFLYHFLRWSEPTPKIAFLAKKAFATQYTEEEIDKWLELFEKRFYANQWKRQAMPDGAKVGLSLSPKGDWRMPPEAKAC
jgi:NAD+ synthase (glutamine-hydrolysing)